MRLLATRSPAWWLALALLLGAPRVAVAGWLDANYRYKKQLVIDHNRVAGSLSHFPVLFSRTDPDLRTVANGGRVLSSSGFDIEFSDATETVRLDHQVERYDPSTGEAVIWVRLPSLSNATDTALFIYFGNSTVSATQERPSPLWSNGGFRGVWHLGETSGDALDSTSYGTRGLLSGAVMRGGAGAIGAAYAFPDAGSRVVMGDPADGHLDFGTGSFTFEAWLYIATNTGTWQNPLYKGSGSVGNPGYSFETTTNGIEIYGQLTDPTSYLKTANATLGLNTWRHYVVVTDRSTDQLRSYLDGALNSTRGLGDAGSLDNAEELSLGGGTSGMYPHRGAIDEVRVAGVALSAAWVTTEFNNQKSPSTFFTTGPLLVNDAGSDAGTADAGATTDAGETDAGKSDAGPTPDAGAALTLELVLDPPRLAAGEASPLSRVRVLDSNRAPLSLTVPLEVTLRTSSARGGFGLRSDDDIAQTMVVSVPASSSEAGFYYRDYAQGIATLTATAPGATVASLLVEITAAPPSGCGCGNPATAGGLALAALVLRVLARGRARAGVRTR